jgi:hypothetical protein
MIKKSMAVLLATLTAVSTVWADGVSVKVNGKSIKFTTSQPFIEDGRTLIPLRGVFEKLGYEISWDTDTKTATLENNNNEIIVSAGKSQLTANGNKISLDVAAKIKDGSMYIPLRAVGEAGGVSVNWDNDTKTVSIYDDAVREYVTEKNSIFRQVDAVSFEKLVFAISNDNVQTVVSEAQNMLTKLDSAYSKLSALNPPAEYIEEHNISLKSVENMKRVAQGVIDAYGKGERVDTEKLLKDIAELKNVS